MNVCSFSPSKKEAFRLPYASTLMVATSSQPPYCGIQSVGISYSQPVSVDLHTFIIIVLSPFVSSLYLVYTIPHFDLFVNPLFQLSYLTNSLNSLSSLSMLSRLRLSSLVHLSVIHTRNFLPSSSSILLIASALLIVFALPFSGVVPPVFVYKYTLIENGLQVFFSEK